jgi:hypothetical protein
MSVKPVVLFILSRLSHFRRAATYISHIIGVLLELRQLLCTDNRHLVNVWWALREGCSVFLPEGIRGLKMMSDKGKR